MVAAQAASLAAALHAATGAVPYQGLHLLGGFKTLRGYDVNEIPAAPGPTAVSARSITALQSATLPRSAF